MNMGFSYSASLSRFRNLPFKLIEGKLFYGDGPKDWIFLFQDTNGVWGTPTDVVEIKSATYPLPCRLLLNYYSELENKYYKIDTVLDKDKAEHLWNEKIQNNKLWPYKNFVVGVAPFGGVAVWMRSSTNEVLLHWFRANLIDNNPGLNNEKAENLKNVLDEIPCSSDDINRCMRQYVFRYVPLEEYWNGQEWVLYDENDLYYDDFEVDDLSHKCIDGTFVRPANFTLFDHHKSGLPSHIAVFWHEGQTAFEAYFWIENNVIIQLFDSIVQTNFSAKIDILVRIDTRTHNYELALRENEIMTSTIIFPKESYQLIIFKNDNQYFKSQNYNQEDGAWDW